MKKLHIIFGMIAGTMTLVATVIAFVMYANNVGNIYTDFPAWSAFVFVGIYYAMGLVILGIIWLVVWLILRHKTCSN